MIYLATLNTPAPLIGPGIGTTCEIHLQIWGIFPLPNVPVVSYTSSSSRDLVKGPIAVIFSGRFKRDLHLGNQRVTT